MRQGLLLCAAVFAVFLASCAPPPRQASPSSQAALSDNLAVVVADVESMGERLGNGDLGAARTLPHDIEVLTRAIEGGKVDAESRLTLLFYRGRARHLLNGINDGLGFPPDRGMAEAAIADFDAVAASAGSEPGELAMSSIYFAGDIAFTALNDPARAMRYYERCSAMKQAGCQNFLAGARISGFAGQRKDLDGAASLFREAYETKLDYGCAGAYSAYSLARMTHFTGVSVEDRTALDWLRRAYRLADQIKVRSHGEDWCGGSFMSVYEYMIRLEGHERKDALLKQAVDGVDEDEVVPAIRTMIGYLKGTASEAEYRKVVEGVSHTDSRCEYALIGVWKSALSKQKSAARAYRDIIGKESGNPSCAENLVYARKYAP